MLEKDIEKKVCKVAADHNWLAIKYTPMGARGWPDRIFVSPKGEHVWIEFKRPGNKPTKMQDMRMNQLRSRGASVHWCDSVEAALTLLGISL